MGHAAAASTAHILVVDDDAGEAAAAVQALTTAGYGVSLCRDGLAGLTAVEDERPRLVVLDWDLPFLTGAIFVFAVRTGLAKPRPMVTVLHAEDDPATAQAVGTSAILSRPLDVAALVRTVHALLGGEPVRLG